MKTLCVRLPSAIPYSYKRDFLFIKKSSSLLEIHIIARDHYDVHNDRSSDRHSRDDEINGLVDRGCQRKHCNIIEKRDRESVSV